MEKYWIVLVFAGPIIGLLALATLAKYIEVWRARSWIAVPGRVVSSKSIERVVKRPGVDAGSEKRNFAEVSYAFDVDGKKRTGTRVSIGEDLGNGDVAETLVRYAPGTHVTVYYNPDDPNQTVLERDPPRGAFQFMALLILALAAGAIVAVDGATWIADVLRGIVPNPKNVPFVIGFGFFALCCALMARAIGKQAQADSQGLWILWLCAMSCAAAAYWFATTSGGKV